MSIGGELWFRKLNAAEFTARLPSVSFDVAVSKSTERWTVDPTDNVLCYPRTLCAVRAPALESVARCFGAPMPRIVDDKVTFTEANPNNCVIEKHSQSRLECHCFDRCDLPTFEEQGIRPSMRR